MLTYQDYEKALQAGGEADFLLKAIEDHKASVMYRTALDADLYDHQKNKTINQFIQIVFDRLGMPVENFTASNSKIASNFFHRLNTQRCTYSLGNGVTFSKVQNEGGKSVDKTKEALGAKFDTDFFNAGYYAIIHGLSFCFWNVKRMHYFKLTECAPLWDENDGRLRACIRFWQIDSEKPLRVEFYTEDGIKYYRSKKDGDKLILIEERSGSAYKITTAKAPIDDAPVIIGQDNYNGRLPIVPFWGSKLHQSTLVGMQQGIDSYDLVRSGFANDLQDVSQIFWILENYGGMKQKDLDVFRERVMLQHVASMDTSQGGKLTPYTQEVPYQARDAFLKGIRSDIYENYGGLDVHTVAAGATNDHIDAAYQPMDENADDFEFCCIETIQQILSLIGIEDTPVFKRNRISNQKEQVEMVIMEADYLDDETIINKFPNISPDEVPGIMERRENQNEKRYKETLPEPPKQKIEDVVV